MAKGFKKRRGLVRITHHIESIFFIGLISLFVIMGVFFLWAASLKMPDIKSFENRKIEQSTKIYDRTGEILLFDVHEDIQRTIIPFENVSRHIKNATIAIEDAEFYEHIGIKPVAFIRAVFANLQTRRFSQGGSTITQQVIKNSILTSEKKISRKLKEWVLAVKLEKALGKDQILELYLNESPYGGNIYGIEEASQMFFGKSASEVTLAESAYLAALPQAPTYYSPYGNYKDDLIARKNLVLEKMLEYNFINENEYKEAVLEDVEFNPRVRTGIKAPHFVMFIREYLALKYGERAMDERGFKVITTLDYELQEIAEEIVERNALLNTEKFNATNASIVAIDPKTGQILTMVGSRNYFDEEIDGNFNIALANRQPGSAFKPFVYATALNKGYTTETVVFDLETQFSTTCDVDDFEGEDDCYSPGNYDNIFRGPITMRNALAQSVNIPAVKFLYLAGLTDSLKTAKAMGISTLTDISQYGLTLVLGGGEVSLLDITSAYGVFANEGIKNPYVGILSVEDSNGVLVEEYKNQPNRVLSEKTSLEISDILSDNVARTPAFGARSYLYFENRDVAVKTGTTNDYRDAWIIGYSPNITVGAWAGNNDNSPMEKKVAGFIIAPLWNEFMQKVFEKLPNERFDTVEKDGDYGRLKPVLRGVWQGSDSYFVDKISGKMVTEHTPEELLEEKFITNVHSILYWVDRNNPRGLKPEYPARDFQFDAWEYGVDKWKTRNGYLDQTASSTIPTEVDDVHKPEFIPNVVINNFNTTKIYESNENIFFDIEIEEKRYTISKVDYFVNNLFIDSKKPPSSFDLILNLDSVDNIKRNNELKIVVYDSVLNKKEIVVRFVVGL